MDYIDVTFGEIEKKPNESPLLSVKEDIIKKAETPSIADINQVQNKNRSFVDSALGVETGVSWTNTQAKLGEAYVAIGDELVPRYKSFLPGVDNNARLAATQTTGEKWTNGLSKAGINLLTTVAGGTIGTLTRTINAIQTGSMEGLYTDDFNDWLFEVNEKMNYTLPNYYTEQEQQENFFESLNNANFWANDVAGGISFTLGTLVSEGIWAGLTGGAGLATRFARWGLKYRRAEDIAEGLTKYLELGGKSLRATAKATKDVNRATNLAKVGEIANTARFTWTSTGYESALETRQMMKEANENFEAYYQELGREPSAQEKAEFENALTSAGNSLYGMNTVLTGASNLAIFGSMFNITNPLFRSGKALTKGINRRLFGIGTTTSTAGGKFVKTAVKPKLGQKILGYTHSFAKAPVIEGVWEEGMQSVGSNTSQNWLKSGYDQDATINNYSLTESFWEGMKETYGSKEGWKEIGIGMIVGLFGGGVSGNFTSYNNAIKGEQAYAEAINSNIMGSQILTDKMFAANQIAVASKEQKQAEDRGDIAAAQAARERQLLSAIAVHKKYGRMDESLKDFETTIGLIDSKKVAEEQGIDIETVDNYKAAVIEEYKELQDKYSKNKDFADYIIGRGSSTTELDRIARKDVVAQAIAYNLTMGENSGENASLMLESIQAELAGLVSSTLSDDFAKALDIKGVLDKASKQRKREYRNAQARRRYTTKQKEAIEAEIADAQAISQRVSAEDTTTKQDNQTRLLELAKRLQVAVEEEATAKKEHELAFQALKINSPFQGTSWTNNGTVTSEELDAIATIEKGEITGGTLFEIDKIINSLQETNPEKYETLKKLFNEYQKTVYAFKEFNRTIEGVSSDSFNPANFNTGIETLIGKGKTANEFTKDFYANVGEQLYQNVIAGSVQDRAEEIAQGDAPATPNADTPVPPAPQQTEPDLNSVEEIENAIKKSLEENSVIASYIGTDIASAEANRPTQEETDEFLELHNNRADLTDEQNERYRELTNKLSKWQVQEGTMIEGINSTLADLLVRLDQLKRSPDTNNTKENLVIQDAVAIEEASEKNTSGTQDSVAMVQTPKGVRLKVLPTGHRLLSHMTITALIEKYIPNVVSVAYTVNGKETKKETTLTELENIQKEDGYSFYLTQENGDVIRIDVLDKSRLRFSKETWENLQGQMSLRFPSDSLPKTNTWIVGYTVNEDGSATPAPSEFHITSDNENLPPEMTAEELHNVETVELYVDKQNHYNQTLIAEVESARNSKTKDKKKKQRRIREAENKLKENAVVYLISNGKIAGTLRAGLLGGKSDGYTNYRLVRESAAKELLENESTNLINLKTTIPIEFTYSGTPIFNIVNNNGQLELDAKELTNRDLEQIVDAGYVEDGTLHIGKLESDDVLKMYLPKTSEKIPVAVIKYRGRSIAIPMSLVGVNTDLTQQFDNLLGLDIPAGQKINRINQFLLNNGIDPKTYMLQEKDLVNTNKLEVLRTSLEGRLIYPNVENWAQENFDLNNLRVQARTILPLSNNPFSTPKLKLSLDNTERGERTLRTEREELVNAQNDKVNEIFPQLWNLLTTPVDYATGTLADIADETDFDPDQFDNLAYRKGFLNTNLPRLAQVKTLPQEYKEQFGEDYLTELNKDIKEYNGISKRLTGVRNKIKLQKETKEQVEETQEEKCAK